jgi:hypothetical protein
MHMVRNFHMEKKSPFRQMRWCEKKMGPGEVNLTIAATISSTGNRTGIMSAAKSKSRPRFTTVYRNVPAG